ncbi:hypothetical protein ACGFZJ_10630 [Streptomyces sp. NPDC048253]|uniref:hypothetical protein n=1 Tax=Streptomyces sp. NPDC048253 TaxID=3365524 RepID=UPI003722FFA6
MSTADEQDRLLREPRRALERARRDPATWTDLAFRAQDTDEGHVTDCNRATRFGVLWALQYDRRPQDLPLLRFLLQQQITYYREAVSWGLAPDLTLAGFLVAEHRQVEDLWLHWDAKNISFDTALGYHLYHLLTGGVAATIETVRAGSHPDRDRILGDITSARHTDAAVEEWLDQQRARFPAEPADEGLKAWAHHAARLGEREASRLFMTEWAVGEPRTDSMLNTLQFHLAHLGYVDEAVAVQKETIAICDNSPGSSQMASKLLGLVRLERQAGHFTEARQSLQAAGQSLSALQDWPWMGMWQSFVKEHFLLVLVAPDGHTGRRLLNEADQYLRDAPQKWLSGVLDSAIAAAGHLNDEDILGRYQALSDLAHHQHEQPRSPGSAGTA